MAIWLLILMIALIAIPAIISAFINLHVASTVRQIHKLVNSRMSDALARIDQLASALEHSDIEVPPDPNPHD